MFPLYTRTFPSSATELTQLLDASLQRVFAGASNPVSVRAKNYPNLADLRVVLDRAQLRPNPPPPPRPLGEGTPALTVDDLEITASALSLGPATADLKLRATDVALHQATDASGDIILTLQSAANGEVEVSADKAELERAIAAVATREAGKHGVSIDQVQVSVSSRGARSVDAEVRLRGRKLFFTTVIRIAAKLDLDEELNARLSGLACHGEGAVGALACSVLEPHLQKLDGKSFALMGLPLGEVRLRDVRLSVGDKLAVNAEFGA